MHCYEQSSADTRPSPPFSSTASSSFRAQERLPVLDLQGHLAPRRAVQRSHRSGKSHKSTQAAAQAHAKPTPHPRDGDCFYKINKTSRTNRHKNVVLQQHLLPVARAPREARDTRAVGGKTNARYQSARRLRVRQQQQPRRVLRCNQKGRWTGNGPLDDGRKNSRGRRKSDTYPHIAGSCTALPASLRCGAAGAREGPGPTGKPREERARRAREHAQSRVPGSAGEERA